MKRKGVCYDVGRVMLGRNWRPEFDPKIVRRELEIIRDDLHCNAVRLQGLDLSRLALAAEYALRLGLEVWFSPEMWDREQGETVAYVVRGAACAEELRARWPEKVVLSVGTEVSLFTPGFVPGRNVLERLSHPGLREIILAGRHNGPLNAYLARVTDAVREQFHGPVTYASLEFETVDWTRFDVVGVDLYRDKRNHDRYPKIIERYRAFGKPLANTEFGCCTFKGADDLGGQGWNVVDWAKVPPELKGTYEYDQATQATEVADLLRVNDEAGVDATFVYTFVEPGIGPQDETERQMLSALKFDLDLVRYSLVKSLPGLGHGTTYPDMPWEPKQSFRAVSEYYASH